MTILVINNKGQYNHRIQRSLQYLKIPSRIQRSLQYLKIPSQLVSNDLSIEEIEAKEPIGLILGGGPSIDDVGNAAEFIKHFDIPILGICLGHQLIAKTFGGEVSTSDTESYAQVKINLLDTSSLFKGLESPSSHKDEVHTLPEEFDIIASSSLCDIEAMKHKEKEIYGIQFHPEVHHTPKGEFIFKNFYEICQNYKNE